MRVIIVPNDQMETPHYSVLRVRKGEETSTLSYLLPKLHEEEMAMPSDEEPAERKLPEQPALAAFVMPDAPPAPAQKSRPEPRLPLRLPHPHRKRQRRRSWHGCPLLQRAEKYVLQRGRD